jgi:diaminopimelate epimerase
MHGLGNDFIVFDARLVPLALTATQVRALTNRHTGIGADTIVVIKPPCDNSVDLSVEFYNADGDAIGTCGNATRCVASLFFAQTGRDQVRIATLDGNLTAWRFGEDVSVDMGCPGLDWRSIDLTDKRDMLHLAVDGPLTDGVGVSMGNPHAVFFRDDVEAVDLSAVGPATERNALFAKRVNVEVAAVLAPDRIRMRVWERGVGITQACGSGACATLVAAVRRGLTERKATLVLDGGDLTIEWRADDHVIMTGPAATSFTGEIEHSLLPGEAPRAAAA